MTWTMPPSVVRLVALILGVASVGSFALALATAPDRGRLPGERAGRDRGAALEAADATPLSNERIEGPPPPPELTPEEKAKLEAEEKAKAEAAAAARAAQAAAQPTPPPEETDAQTTPAQPQPDRVGEILEKAAPPADEPVF